MDCVPNTFLGPRSRIFGFSTFISIFETILLRATFDAHSSSLTASKIFAVFKEVPFVSNNEPRFAR